MTISVPKLVYQNYILISIDYLVILKVKVVTLVGSGTQPVRNRLGILYFRLLRSSTSEYLEAALKMGKMGRNFFPFGRVHKSCFFWPYHKHAGLAQSVERQALNLMVVGSIPTFGAHF